MTLSFFFRRASHVWLPINPAPPVTSIAILPYNKEASCYYKHYAEPLHAGHLFFQILYRKQGYKYVNKHGKPEQEHAECCRHAFLYFPGVEGKVERAFFHEY